MAVLNIFVKLSASKLTALILRKFNFYIKPLKAYTDAIIKLIFIIKILRQGRGRLKKFKNLKYNKFVTVYNNFDSKSLFFL